MSSTLRAVNRLQTLAPGCPDCPAVLSNRLTGMVEGPEASPGCMFRAVRIGEREMLPLQWSENCEFALVRRGVVARQFADAGGAAATIDLAGPGSLFRLVQDRESSIASYALSDAVLCLCTPDAFRSALREDSTNATDMIALVVIVRRNSPRDAPDHFADTGNKTASGTPGPGQRIVDRVGLGDRL